MLGKLTIMTKPVMPDDDPPRLASAVRYLRVGTSRNKLKIRPFNCLIHG